MALAAPAPAASRQAVLTAAAAHLDSGDFARDLARRVARPTESQNPAAGPVLQAYLDEELAPTLTALGFRCRSHAKPVAGGGPLMTARRVEDPALPTVWVPHSHAGCSQHAPDEHLLAPVAREELQIMAGLFWDLGDPATPPPARTPPCSAH